MTSSANDPQRDRQHALSFSSPSLSTAMGPGLDGYINTSPGQAFPQRHQMLSQQEHPSIPCEALADGHSRPGGLEVSPTFHVAVTKRKRNRKRTDKRFDCTIQGCGKSYSRAEHLARHQLNHNTNQTFRCEYPACSRTFVRGDLLKRHMERHAMRGLKFSQGDSTADPHLTTDSANYTTGSPYTPVSTPSVGLHDGTLPTNSTERYRPDAAAECVHSRSTSQDLSTADPGPPAPSNPESYDAFGQRNVGSSVYNSSVASQAPAPPMTLQDDSSMHMAREQYHDYLNKHLPADLGQPCVVPGLYEYPRLIRGAPSEMMALDQIGMPGIGPIFGNDGGLNQSPDVGMPEDFMAYLFNAMPSTRCHADPVLPAATPNYGDLQKTHYSVPFLISASSSMGHVPVQAQQVMAVQNLLHQSTPHGSLSEQKSQEIFSLIEDRFHENDIPQVDRQRERIIGGDRTQDHHPLSHKMMQMYMCSYWYYFSDQMPILHQPTFSADQTPNLLILAMIALGAACLDRIHEQPIAMTGIDIANYIARHLRWEIFRDWSFLPPAKLWVFQALILLEIYEKTYSTRELHERAHIHHATTVTLMRRGRSLIGKLTADSPQNQPGDSSGSATTFAQGSAQAPDEWWSRWIVGEATRRAAFAAFVVDTTHATMFGHSAVMFAHELRLALPCDESLWQAKSTTELAQIKCNLLSQGSKPMSFLEGVKRVLGRQEVQTTSFGRTVLMAGLLSVAYHMQQRDLMVNILGGGITPALGGRDKWRATLTAAYDSLKANFDRALEQSGPLSDPYRCDAARHEFDVVFYLARMAMHADVVDCQIFARAKRLLGRTIGPAEFDAAQRRIRTSWVSSPGARASTFLALRFLGSVLLPRVNGGTERRYEARYDLLMNRPWVLYYAALTVWCYGFALEGPAVESRGPMSPHQVQEEMRRYLLHLGRAADPSELQLMSGINQNTALLTVLKESLENTHWDLLREGANLLNNCIRLNSGDTVL